jgi:hypothetical protein
MLGSPLDCGNYDGGTACKKRKISDTTCCRQSSSELGWSKVRSYGRGKWAHPAEPETKITILLDGSEGTSGCRIGGSWRPEHIPGNVWVKPIGGKYDEGYTTTAKKIRVLNLHLIASVFTQLGDYYGLPAALDRFVRYVCGEQDEVVGRQGNRTFDRRTLAPPEKCQSWDQAQAFDTASCATQATRKI